MPKLTIQSRFPDIRPEHENTYFEQLHFAIGRRFEDLGRQINALSEGAHAASYGAVSAKPTTGVFARGDFVTKLHPAEAGTAGSKYLIHGWTCVSDGSASAASFVEARYLTGN